MNMHDRFKQLSKDIISAPNAKERNRIFAKWDGYLLALMDAGNITLFQLRGYRKQMLDVMQRQCVDFVDKF